MRQNIRTYASQSRKVAANLWRHLACWRLNLQGVNEEALSPPSLARELSPFARAL